MLEKNFELQKKTFNEYFKESLIFHIPHSSTFIPFKIGYDESLIENEIQLLTDWYTDKIFDVEGTKKLVTPWSRVFCDVERLDDENEEMFKMGRGFYYTKTDDGKDLRDEHRLDIKTLIKQKYYNKHHRIFENLVQETLDVNGFATIIDCHSFSNVPFKTDLNQDLNRPDICIGIDDYHTPLWLLHLIKNKFVGEGFSVKINNPYSGTIVPQKFYKTYSLVSSIMIEINRDLYMKNDIVIFEKVKNLNKIISEIF